MKICANCIQDEDECKCMWSGIRKLQKKIKNLEEENNKLKTCRIPHKCPVCEGTAKVKGEVNPFNKFECNACEGKGIVWEPK